MVSRNRLNCVAIKGLKGWQMPVWDIAEPSGPRHAPVGAECAA